MTGNGFQTIDDPEANQEVNFELLERKERCLELEKAAKRAISDLKNPITSINLPDLTSNFQPKSFNR